MTNAGFNMGNWLIDLGSPLVVAMTVLLLVSLLLTWRAVWQRLYATHPSRAVIVMALNLVAFVTVFLLLSEPQRNHLVSRDALLITEGAKTETKNQFDGKSVYVSPGTETTPEALQNLKNANWLLDVAQLPLREPALASIEIRGFGSFVIKNYGSYEGRNPKTGEKIKVRPKKLPFFKVGKDLREQVNKSK